MPLEPTDDERQRWGNWQVASRRLEIASALRGLYRDLDQAVADYGPTCWASGKCCKFDTYGHRLYVTGLEIAWFVDRLGEPGAGRGEQLARTGEHGNGNRHGDRQDALSIALPMLGVPPAVRAVPPDPLPASPIADACRYQRDGKCSVHAIRPLGCRIYFCQEGTDDWQHATYEAFQQRLVKLHEEHAISYHYMEWRAGLIEADRWLPRP